MEERMAKKDKKSVKDAPEAPVTEEGTIAQEEVASEPDPRDAALAQTQAKLEDAAKKADEYLNLAQRVQADFDNFRRRNQSVRADAFEDGAKEFIKTLLPVLDNLERALAAPSQDEALHTGVQMVHKQLCDALQKRGVTVIDRRGEKFDPMRENAVMQGAAGDGEPGTVCEVLQKGYALGNAVLRHAAVKVVPE